MANFVCWTHHGWTHHPLWVLSTQREATHYLGVVHLLGVYHAKKTDRGEGCSIEGGGK